MDQKALDGKKDKRAVNDGSSGATGAHYYMAGDLNNRASENKRSKGDRSNNATAASYQTLGTTIGNNPVAGIEDEQVRREQERRKNQLERMQPANEKRACADCLIF